MLKTVEMIRTSELCADILDILCGSHEVHEQMETRKLGVFTAALSAAGQTPAFAHGTSGHYDSLRFTDCLPARWLPVQGHGGIDMICQAIYQARATKLFLIITGCKQRTRTLTNG